MRALVCGSMAYDTIMVFPDYFKQHILPDQIHMLNVSFLVPEMRRELGGCAGNIAYNLKLLGGDPVIMATVGDDFGDYAARLAALGLESRHIRTIPGTYTAQAFITTDLADNQITAFHPGAMQYAHENRVAEAEGIALGIVSPDGREGMFAHAAGFRARNIPFFFDPGQAIPMFSGEDIRDLLDQATYAVVNDYEASLLVAKTGESLAGLAGRVEALIVTQGAAGAEIHTGGRTLRIPAAPAAALVDPTGCGDAFRGGLLYGLLRGLDWETTGRIAALMGALKIAHRGGQNHDLGGLTLAEHFRQAFGYDL